MGGFFFPPVSPLVVRLVCRQLLAVRSGSGSVSAALRDSAQRRRTEMRQATKLRLRAMTQPSE